MQARRIAASLLWIAAAWLISLPAFASAVFETLRGDVKVVNAGAVSAPSRGTRIEPGASVLTGSDGQALLRFDDGQAILINPDSEFKITAYQYNRDRPQSDSIVFDLLKGALRSVSGLIGSRNANAYALRVPQATIGIRGTDFMVEIVNPLYMSVLTGSISATNAAGAATFAAGSVGTVASATTLAASISAAALPGTVAASFGSMSSVTISTVAGAGAAGGGTGSGAGAASGAASGGVSAGVVGAAAAAAAAAAALTSSNDNNTTGTSGTTGTTGTR